MSERPVRSQPRLLGGYLRLASVASRLSRGRLGQLPGVRVAKAAVERRLAHADEVLIEVDGHRFLVPCDGVALSGCAAYADRRYEALFGSLFASSIRPGATVIDVGASVGFYTLVAARLTGPQGKVFAFEPAPRDFRLLAKNVSLNVYGHVTCISKAVSDHCGNAAFYLSPKVGYHSLFSASDSAAQMHVMTTTLDAELRGTRFDVLKLDIEGAELQAVRGARQLLRKNRPRVFLEVNPQLLGRSGSTARELISELQSIGFIPSLIDEREERLVPLTSSVIQAIEARGAGCNLLCEPN